MTYLVGCTRRLELWGGIECTRNRVRNGYLDQLQWNGHDRRPEDLDRIAELGIRTLRYPILWERVAPRRPDESDWSWADQRLTRLRSVRIRPIVGLVHHGSGPVYTNLLDPAFATGLATFARQLAERFPWLDAYTPVNEPLTTARFSALYGHWYPHHCDGLSFARALLNQCRASVLAMEAIRSIHPGAEFVQTEDLGKTYSTPLLTYQAEFENERRWLTFDLLCGRLDRHHPMGEFLLWLGVPEEDLMWFHDHPCPPSIVGLNHYITSERFLDERLELYPGICPGGNGRHRYVDIEAVRARSEQLAGPGQILREGWARYQLPLAITEVHLGCTREEQLRWLWEVWQAARAVCHDGIDVRAVTVWSLLGTFDWDSLVTRVRGHYEPGAFDVRSTDRRSTAIAGLVRDLAASRQPDHPVLGQPGWWHRPARLLGVAPQPGDCPGGRPILIAGATGTLGRAFELICTARGLPFRMVRRAQMDITDPKQVQCALKQYDPWAVVNAAGYVRVDDAEREPSACFRANAHGPAVIAQACARAGVRFITYSSDLVFDGRQRLPYRESDPVAPLCVYGLTKAEAERLVLALHPKALVIRTSAFFGPWDEYNFAALGLRTMKSGQPFEAATDVVVSPTYVPDLVHVSLDLLIDGEHGIWHLANQGETTWAAFAQRLAVLADLDPVFVKGRPCAAMGLTAPRPSYSPLGSERSMLLPSLEDAMVRYFRDRPPEDFPEAGRTLSQETVAVA